jgi:hypothetical protein
MTTQHDVRSLTYGEIDAVSGGRIALHTAVNPDAHGPGGLPQTGNVASGGGDGLAAILGMGFAGLVIAGAVGAL